MRDLYELYALGLLEEPELSEVEAELVAGSPEARARLRHALENNAMLLAMVPSAEPSVGLRDRVLQSVGVRPQRRAGSMWSWAAACTVLLAAVIYLAVQSSSRSGELAAVRTQLNNVSLEAADSNVQLVRARAMLDFLSAPETRVVIFGPTDPKPPKGKVLINPGRGVLLVASNLPPAPASKIYEMWVIPRGSTKPLPAGLFQSGRDGNALHLHETPLGPGATIAVSLEPEAGSDAPTTTPLFAAAL